MIYTFYKDGEQIQSIEAETLKEAEEKTGVKVSAESGISYTANEVERKPRKTRIDKGLKRTQKVVDSTQKRKRPGYFVFNGVLSQALTHDKALDFVANQQDTKYIRVIMGHEVRFSRKVQFHNE